MKQAFAIVAVVALVTACTGKPATRAPGDAPQGSVAPRDTHPPLLVAGASPDPRLTPGVILTSDPAVICVRGYATRTRAQLTGWQWTVRRREVERRYGLSVNPGEIDHLLPVEGGGSNDLRNLWPEPSGHYQVKDRAENALHRAICEKGATEFRTLRLQTDFLKRWRNG